MTQSLTSEAKLQNLIDKLSSTDLLSPSNPDNELLVEPKANIRIFSPSTSSQSSSVVVTPLNQEDTNSKEQEDQQDGLSLSQRKKNHLRIQTTILDQDLNKQQQSSPVSTSSINTNTKTSTDVASDSDSESELNPDFPALPPPPTSLTPGKHYALYPFKGTDPSHCSMNQDDEVELLNDQDSYWWLVRNQGSASASASTSSGEKKTTDNQDDSSSYAGKIGFVPVDCLEDYCERLARLNCWKNEETEKALTKERFSSWGEEPQQELRDQQDLRLVRVKFDEEVLSYDCEDTYRYDSSDEEYGQGQDQFDDSDEEFERRLLHGFNRNYDDEDGESYEEEEQGDIRRTEIEDDEQDIVHSDSSSSMSDSQYEDLLTTTTATPEDNSNSNVQRPIETNSDIASESFVAPLTLTKPMKRQQRRKPPTFMADGIIDQSTPEPIQHPYFQDINTGIAVDDFAPLQPGSFILNHNNDSNVGSIGTYSPSTASEYTPPMSQDQQQRFSDSASGEESKDNKKNPKKKEEDGQRNRSVWLLEELIKDELRDAKKDLGTDKDQGQSKELEEELNNSTIIDTEENDIGDTTFNSITPPTTTTTKNENVDDSFEGDDLIAHLSKLPLVLSGELQRPKLLTELTPPLSQSSLLIATDTATAATDDNVDVTISSPTSASTTSSSSRSNSDIIMSSASLSKYNDNPSNSNSSDTTIATHTISGSVSNNELHPDIKTMFQESMMRFDKLEIMLREAQERLG
ncbi:hypothetical protein WICPIJ_006567 [Wickerhamomyces pijperi]|uniref:SH3 domain-containing protein n=1 Tax=Wickerhamomyces pijperi TaxID=599730 RepID=A0A9P8TKV6_WICPI|nr:hypothetical protein WICPIJ_006567 [Wickerhamomyces pijperi]